MNLQECAKLCEQLLDVSLSPEERREIEAQVAAQLESGALDENCANELRFARNLSATLPDLARRELAPPTFLRANVRAALVENALVEETRAGKPLWERLFAPLWLRSLGAGTAFVALGFLLLSRQIAPPDEKILEPRSENEIAAQIEKTPNRKSARKEAEPEILSDRAPAPRRKVFEAPQPQLSPPLAIRRTPETQSSPRENVEGKNVDREKTNRENVKRETPTRAPEPPKSSRPPIALPNQRDLSAKTRATASKTAAPLRLPSPAKPLADSGENRARVSEENPQTFSKPARTDADEAALFSTRNNAENLARSPAEHNVPLRSQHAPIPPPPALRAPITAAPRDWRDGKISLVRAPKTMRPDAAITSNSDRARGGAGMETNGSFELGSGSQRLRSSSHLRNSSQKLILKSEIEVRGAVLKLGGKAVWNGDLTPDTAVEIEVPGAISEGSRFVLEQKNAGQESKEKTLELRE